MTKTSVISKFIRNFFFIILLRLRNLPLIAVFIDFLVVSVVVVLLVLGVIGRGVVGHGVVGYAFVGHAV